MAVKINQVTPIILVIETYLPDFARVSKPLLPDQDDLQLGRKVAKLLIATSAHVDWAAVCGTNSFGGQNAVVKGHTNPLPFLSSCTSLKVSQNIAWVIKLIDNGTNVTIESIWFTKSIDGGDEYNRRYIMALKIPGAILLLYSFRIEWLQL